jgi:hypothetical protein
MVQMSHPSLFKRCFVYKIATLAFFLLFIFLGRRQEGGVCLGNGEEGFWFPLIEKL